MTREEFCQTLIEHGRNPAEVGFDDSAREGDNVRKNRIGWEVFYRERGKEYRGVGYPSESCALEALLAEMLKRVR